MRSLLLIAHGSRRAEANADGFRIAEMFKNRAGFADTQCAFLELAEPTIEEGGRMCVERGASVVVMMPYFLSAGVHVREDLKEAQHELSEQYPNVEFRLAEPLGLHPLILDVVEQRALEAMTPSTLG